MIILLVLQLLRLPTTATVMMVIMMMITTVLIIEMLMISIITLERTMLIMIIHCAPCRCWRRVRKPRNRGTKARSRYTGCVRMRGEGEEWK